MDDNITDLLKTSSTFLALDEAARKYLSNKFTRINLNAEDIVFYQGDPSDSVYLLISGRLSAQLMTGIGTSRIVGYIEPGETVGELGVLSNEPRSLTIKATKNSVLLKLTAKDFKYICLEYPKVMYNILRPLMARTSSLIRYIGTEKNNKHIVIVSANRTLSLEKFAEKLEEYAALYPTMLVISEFHPEFSDSKQKIAIVKEKIMKTIQQRKSTRRILYILNSVDTAVAKIAFKHANLIYVTANTDATPSIDNPVLEEINSRRPNLSATPILILLHPNNAAQPKNTLSWLKVIDSDLHHHIRMNSKKDMLRLFRFMRGKAVGVVLSGGGTRGWAHIGALKALRHAKVPIDIIGGSSVGALVAGCYAYHVSYDDAFERFKQIVIESTHTISWRGLTLPIISIFSSKNYTQAQINAFGEQQIEDLWMPYFCITSNLAHNTEDVQRTGTLWEKIRASTAIPGMIPPMLLNGELHIDGGLINNLPVDVMRKYVGHRGRVIAIELNTFSPDQNHYDFPPVLTFWDTLLNKLGLKKPSYKIPKFVDTFLRGLFVGSDLRSRQNAISANTFVSLNLNEFNMLHSDTEEGLRLIQVGYDETMKQLKQAKETAESS